VSEGETASTLQLVGAGAFGALIGWFLYYVNRYRRGNVQLKDVVTVVGAIGGAAIMAIFPERTDLFGAYGIGLFAGFFGYFLVLLLFVLVSRSFTIEWFLDGRRPPLPPGWNGLEPEERPAMETDAPAIDT
jgi:hypothetical protein